MDSSSLTGGDDRWKLLSRKGWSRSGRPHAMDATAGSVLSRSYSATVSSSRSSTTSTTGCTAAAGTGDGASSSSSSSSRLLSKKKCVEAVKEHRARFYIVRRCVSMLVCWRDY